MDERDDASLLALISAVASGDADRGDVAARMREMGIDSLDVLLEVVAAWTRAAPARRSLAVRLDPGGMLPPLDEERRRQIVHPRPTVPLLVRGVLYDPEDIARFDGRELHMIATRPGDPVLAIDDGPLMRSWWQMSYIETMTQRGSTSSGGVRPEGWGGGSRGGYIGVTYTPDPPGTPPPPPRRTATFHEDDGFRGSDFETVSGWGYEDLTELSYTFLGTGDWNDTISSISFHGATTAILYEHVGWGGSTLTLGPGDVWELRSWGWNDRASGAGCW